MRPEAGDHATTVESLYRDRYDGLARLGMLLTGSGADGEDLAQAAFVSLAQCWDEVRSPPAYLRQVVVNQASEFHRRSSRRLPARPVRLVGEPEVDETWAAVQALPAVQRTVVVLRFYEDMTLVDIAALLDRRESTVRSDLRRGLLQLRKGLTHDR